MKLDAAAVTVAPRRLELRLKAVIEEMVVAGPHFAVVKAPMEMLAQILVLRVEALGRTVPESAYRLHNSGVAEGGWLGSEDMSEAW